MDKKNNDPPSNKSSLLLKYPIDLFSPHSNNENILMPIGVPDTSGNFNSSIENAKKEDAQNISEPGISSSTCQLEQPLLFRRVSSPDMSDAVATSVHAATADSDASILRPGAQSCYESPDITVIADSPSVYPELSTLFSDPEAERKKAPLSAYPDHTGSLRTPTFALKSITPTSINFFHLCPSENAPFVYGASPGPEMEFTSQLLDTRNICDTVKPHWMFQDNVESKEIWYGFSEWDSERLENAFQQGKESVISTDGGRYDVYIETRIKKSVYFYSKELHVRRCTWFYQLESMTRFKPYDEEIASYLEECYRDWVTSNAQDKRFVADNFDGTFLFEKPAVMLHYAFDSSSWAKDSKGCPRILKRGLPDGFQVLPNESPQIDNLLFIVQGIGSFCDLRFRTVSECVDGFRDIANKLIESHFKKDTDQGHIGRVEILPVAWHAKFRTSDIGLDKTMKRITLPSIPKLRHFTNDTLIDILLYSSPSYCQSILDTVAEELNALYETFISRNPGFSGKVFVAGHSLGSLIIFDILSNQNVAESDAEKEFSTEENSQIDKKTVEEFSDITELLKSLDLEDYLDAFKTEKIDLLALPHLTDEDLTSLGLPIGPRRKLMNIVKSEGKVLSRAPTPNLGESRKFASSENLFYKLENTFRNLIFPFQKPSTGIKTVVYPRLHFHPAGFFAMGSPISMFLAIRGFDTISEKYSFPTCPAFFHIFHPYDPVAFRIEPMIDRNFDQKPALIPHHKGRKRMHLEIKDNVAKIASELRQKFMDTLHKTWSSFSEIAGLHPFPSAAIETEVNSIVSQEIPEIPFDDNLSADISIGNLNGGRRIDYVLQEKPLEALNDYVWALTSHATYWDSEDTVLMILREIYSTQGITASLPNEADNLVPEDLSTTEPCAKEHIPFSNEFFEKTLCSNLPVSEKVPINTSVPLTSTVKNSISATTMPINTSAPLTSTVKTSISATTMPLSAGASVFIPGVQYQSASLTPTMTSSVNATAMPSSAGATVFIPTVQYQSASLTPTTTSFVNATAMPSSAGATVFIPTVQYQSASLTPTTTSSVNATSMPSSSGASVSIPGSKHIGPPPLSGFVKRSPFTK